MAHPKLDALVAAAVRRGPTRLAVAFPCSVDALRAAAAAREKGLADPILVGPETTCRTIAASIDLDLAGIELRDTGDSAEAAAADCVELCRSGAAQAIMKGSLHTDKLLAAVVRKEAGLRTGRRMSHVFVFDAPSYDKPLMMADCVLNIAPGLMEKRDIIQNAVDLAMWIGVTTPSVAVLSAVETINPSIPGTIEAAALSKMAERGQIRDAVVDGPLAFDVAISAMAAKTKSLRRPGGDPDLLIVPNLEAGNMLYKQLIYLGGAECAGLILGARVPIVLTSRADSIAARVASCALANLASGAAG